MKMGVEIETILKNQIAIMSALNSMIEKDAGRDDVRELNDRLEKTIRVMERGYE